MPKPNITRNMENVIIQKAVQLWWENVSWSICGKIWFSKRPFWKSKSQRDFGRKNHPEVLRTYKDDWMPPKEYYRWVTSDICFRGFKETWLKNPLYDEPRQCYCNVRVWMTLAWQPQAGGGGGGRWRIEKRMQRKKWGLYSMREGKETERNGKKMRGMGMREREREKRSRKQKSRKQEWVSKEKEHCVLLIITARILLQEQQKLVKAEPLEKQQLEQRMGTFTSACNSGWF